MDNNSNNSVVANNSNSNEVAANVTPQTQKVKAVITAINRGQSEETKMSLFFRAQSSVFPKTDENGVHSLGFSFGKAVQCVEDLIALYPFRIKAKFSQIKDLDNRIDFANMLFQSMTGKTFIVSFEMIPANTAYRDTFVKPHDWWCATRVDGPQIEMSADEIAFVVDEAQRYINVETTANVPQWTHVG